MPKTTYRKKSLLAACCFRESTAITEKMVGNMVAGRRTAGTVLEQYLREGREN